LGLLRRNELFSSAPFPPSGLLKHVTWSQSPTERARKCQSSACPCVTSAVELREYLVFGINKPLSCLCQHGPQPGSLTNYVLEILPFVGKNLLEPPYSSGVYLSQLPSIPGRQGHRHLLDSLAQPQLSRRQLRGTVQDVNMRHPSSSGYPASANFAPWKPFLSPRPGTSVLHAYITIDLSCERTFNPFEHPQSTSVHHSVHTF